MKVLLLVCDGIGDRPIEELGGKTPLEAAHTPNMDALAAKGECGISDPISPGVRAGSDTSHLAIMGYDPYETYTGRGPLEAAGLGMEVKPGDIAFRCNFATLDENMVLTDRRAGRIADSAPLAEPIDNIKLDGAEVLFKSLSYRGALILRGEGLSDKVSDTDPHVTGEKVHKAHGLDGSPEAEKTARLLNDFTGKVYEVLKDHPYNQERLSKGELPGNMALTRGVGMAPDLEAFSEKTGFDPCCMATTSIIKGFAAMLGMERIDVKPDYKERIGQALEILQEKDFILMNIKEPDEAGHDNEPQRKVAVIEEVDRALEQVLDFVDDNYFILLSDHSTPCGIMDHSGDPTPVIICGPGVRTDHVKIYGERACARGGLNRIRHMDIIPILLNLMNKSKKYGA